MGAAGVNERIDASLLFVRCDLGGFSVNGQLSLFDVFWSLFAIGMGVIGYQIGSRVLGSSLIGILCAFASFAFPYVIGELVYRSIGREPFFPPCDGGDCRSCDYRIGKVEPNEIEVVCKCGNKYLFKGKRFMRVLENGQIKAFMRLNVIRRWVDDC